MIRRLASLLFATTILLGSCTDQPSAESICLLAVGELQQSFQTYEDLLERGVEDMRAADAVSKLETVSGGFSELLDELNQRGSDVASEAKPAHDLMVSGVGMQVSAWMSIRDGLRFQDSDLIDDGAELIALSRDVIDESRLATPDCGLDG